MCLSQCSIFIFVGVVSFAVYVCVSLLHLCVVHVCLSVGIFVFVCVAFLRGGGLIFVFLSGYVCM